MRQIRHETGVGIGADLNEPPFSPTARLCARDGRHTEQAHQCRNDQQTHRSSAKLRPKGTEDGVVVAMLRSAATQRQARTYVANLLAAAAKCCAEVSA